MDTPHVTGEGSTPSERYPEHASLSRLWSISIIATAAAALLLKLLLAARTYGTNDVYRYEAFMAASRYFGVFIYRAIPEFNHPPSMIHVLRLFGYLANATGLPFAFWLRVPGILADAASVWVLWKIMGPRLQDRSIRWALLLFAAAPPLVLISGFHGNTDTVMIFFLLLSVYLNEKGTHTWLAGAMFGVSMCFKITPVISAPAIFFYLRNPKKQISFFAATGGVLLIAWSPFIFQDPWFILHQVFGYRSSFGHWGLSFFSNYLVYRQPVWGLVNYAYWWAGSYVLLAGITGFSFWMNRTPNRPRLYSQVGIVFCLFLSLTTGFGVQYLAWLVPWVVGLGALPTAVYFVASGSFLFLVYNYWSQGIPWYMADSYNLGDYQGHLDYFQLACWLSVVVISIIAWKQIQAPAMEQHPAHVSRSARVLQFAGMAAALVLLVYSVQWQARRDNTFLPWQARQNSALRVRAAQFSLLSLQLYHMDRYQEAISAARQSATLWPDSPDAYANLAASYAALHNWDEAVQNAQQAFHLKPNSSLLKNNLDRILEEKQKAAGSESPR